MLLRQHYERSQRPGEVWFALCLLHRNNDIPEEVIRMIHCHVMSLPGEREGMLSFNDRCERERSARKEMNTERVVHRWALFGFGSLLEFLHHTRQERCFFDELEATKRPEWSKFGFHSAKSYRRAVRRATRRHAPF
jgi:hypothetical protein